MLETPFGLVKIYLDGRFIPIVPAAVNPEKSFSDVDGCFLFPFPYKSDGTEHILEFRIEGNFKNCFPEVGERLECMSFYTEQGKISLGCEASFGDYTDYGYDFDGYLMTDGICIVIFPETQSQTFYFAVSWLLSCDELNDHQTWYGADPWYLKQFEE